MPHSFQLYLNPAHKPGTLYSTRQQEILSLKGFERAKAIIPHWPGYAQTPLADLRSVAESAHVGAVWYKDESPRFGLRSFKGLGGAYAVYRVLEQQVKKASGASEVSPQDMLSGKYKYFVSKMTVTCATDGNHGRSVAWGAQMFGAQCVIYIHARVSEGRRKAIEAYGAKVVRCTGNYDDSVRQAQTDATANGWVVISDTSYEGYMDIPRDVMQGYSVMVDEAVHQLPGGQKPTHVFLQGGVGGMAAAVAAHLWELWGKDAPAMIVVEPEKADCLYQSAKAGTPVTIHGDLDTMMAGLACGEVSLLAWEILHPGTRAFMTIPDEAAMDAMRLLAKGSSADAPRVAGESAVAGLAGLLALDDSARTALGITKDSRILLFGTEGDTDPELYQKIVGKTADEVRSMPRAA